jgi:chromosome segregation ATPase
MPLGICNCLKAGAWIGRIGAVVPCAHHAPLQPLAAPLQPLQHATMLLRSTTPGGRPRVGPMTVSYGRRPMRRAALTFSLSSSSSDQGEDAAATADSDSDSGDFEDVRQELDAAADASSPASVAYQCRPKNATRLAAVLDSSGDSVLRAEFERLVQRYESTMEAHAAEKEEVERGVAAMLQELTELRAATDASSADVTTRRTDTTDDGDGAARTLQWASVSTQLQLVRTRAEQAEDEAAELRRCLRTEQAAAAESVSAGATARAAMEALEAETEGLRGRTAGLERRQAEVQSRQAQAEAEWEQRLAAADRRLGEAKAAACTVQLNYKTLQRRLVDMTSSQQQVEEWLTLVRQELRTEREKATAHARALGQLRQQLQHSEAGRLRSEEEGRRCREEAGSLARLHDETMQDLVRQNAELREASGAARGMHSEQLEAAEREARVLTGRLRELERAGAEGGGATAELQKVLHEAQRENQSLVEEGERLQQRLVEQQRQVSCRHAGDDVASSRHDSSALLLLHAATWRWA